MALLHLKQTQEIQNSTQVSIYADFLHIYVYIYILHFIRMFIPYVIMRATKHCQNTTGIRVSKFHDQATSVSISTISICPCLSCTYVRSYVPIVINFELYSNENVYIKTTYSNYLIWKCLKVNRFSASMLLELTHWGQVTHICISKLTTISEPMRVYSFHEKNELKMSSAKWVPFCLGLTSLRFMSTIYLSLHCWSYIEGPFN